MLPTGHLTESDPNGRPPGEPSVLVTYASRFGSTRGVAKRIAARLTEHGSRVELNSVDEVDDESAYDAVVVGGAVFNRRWMPEGEGFVRRNLGALAGRPVWLFSVGTFGDSKRFNVPPRGGPTLDEHEHRRASTRHCRIARSKQA